MAWFRRLGVGVDGGDCDETRINDDGRRRGVPLPGLGDGGWKSDGPGFAVLTMGIAWVEEPGTGRMMTSPPSKFNVSLDLSSVSAVTGSELTITGYRAERSCRM
jgi:hypothetical protein